MNHDSWWRNLLGSHLYSYTTPWIRGLNRSRDKINYSMSSTKVGIITKHNSLVTYVAWLPPIQIHGPLVTWSCQITWKVKLLYLHEQSVYSHKTGQVDDLPWGTPIHIVAWPLNHVALRDYDLKTSHLYYHNTYGRQTWQYADSEELPLLVRWYFNQDVFRGY